MLTVMKGVDKMGIEKMYEDAEYLKEFVHKIWEVADDNGRLTEDVGTDDDYAFARKGEYAYDVEVEIKRNFIGDWFGF